MFLGLPYATPYADPWNEPFEVRFRTLVSRPRRIAYYYTRPDNSTFRYRCYNMVQTVNVVSGDTAAAWFCEEDGDRLGRVADTADVLVLGRIQYSTGVARLVDRARRRNARVLFDVDDLVYDTRHAELLMSSLDQGLGPDAPWNYWFAYMGRIGAALRLCDGAVTTNDFLAAQIRADTGLPAGVVPNYLNREQATVSEAVAAAKTASGWRRDRRVHIGYFSGSPTHARDFAIVAPTLALLLDEDQRLMVRMVGMLEPHPALAPHAGRVEIHPFTDFVNLQRLIGATEVNLAPLQSNLFTNSKSELKFFEAAAVATITVASPTSTFRAAIEEGRTGFLANELEWGEAIRRAVARLDDGGYAEMGLAARQVALARYEWMQQWPAIEQAAFGDLPTDPSPALSATPNTLAVRPRSDDAPIRIEVTRDARTWTVDPATFGLLALRKGDALAVVPSSRLAGLLQVWGDTHVPITPGNSIRVPAKWEIFGFKGFDIPAHLIRLTGAGPETFDTIGKGHIAHYQQHIGLWPSMTILDLGCGIGRVAFQLLDYLDDHGRYIGLDVIRDSIDWCSDQITPRFPNFGFHHFDAFSDLYNPYGRLASSDVRLPVPDGSVDRIVLASVFTHLLRDEVAHYLKEFRRVLKPDGLIYASFFLYSEPAIIAARTKGNTAWKAAFEHDYGDGVYGNDPTYARGAVAYTDAAMQRLIAEAGLVLKRPYLKGWWSGLHAEPDDGQDAAIIGRP